MASGQVGKLFGKRKQTLRLILEDGEWWLCADNEDFKHWVSMETENTDLVLNSANEILQIFDDYLMEEKSEYCIVQRFKRLNDAVKSEKELVV